MFGKVCLMSRGDMEFHFSRETCVMQVTLEEIQLLAESFQSCRIWPIQGSCSPLFRKRGIGQSVESGVFIKILSATPTESQKRSGVMRKTCELTLSAILASMRRAWSLADASVKSHFGIKKKSSGKAVSQGKDSSHLPCVSLEKEMLQRSAFGTKNWRASSTYRLPCQQIDIAEGSQQKRHHV